jgi:AraC-like DNA-binding protein
MQFSTITSWARLIWDALATYGIDGDAVFDEVGLDPARLNDASGRYPVPAMQRLWRVAAERTRDPCFGLVAAEQWHPTTWGGLGYAWLASATLEESFRRLVRYSGIISTAANVTLEETAGNLRLKVSADPRSGLKPSPVVIDALAANIVHMCRIASGPGFTPTAVDLSHGGMGCRRRRQEFFKAPIRYDAQETTIFVDAASARERLPSANTELAHANERVIADYLAELRGTRIAMRLRARLIDELPSGRTTERQVAEWLHMSRRTLQRKLRDEGTSYTRELDGVRRELAERFIRDRSLTLSEITYLLGFAEISSFSRAFKRWTGKAPSVYRQEALEAGVTARVAPPKL